MLLLLIMVVYLAMMTMWLLRRTSLLPVKPIAQRLLVGGRIEEATTVLARYVGDIDEAVEVAANAGQPVITHETVVYCKSCFDRTSFTCRVARTGIRAA
jgi:hypothetical protein